MSTILSVIRQQRNLHADATPYLQTQQIMETVSTLNSENVPQLLVGIFQHDSICKPICAMHAYRHLHARTSSYSQIVIIIPNWHALRNGKVPLKLCIQACINVDLRCLSKLTL